MARPKRSPFQIQRDKIEIQRLYLQGKTQAVIAQEITALHAKDIYGDTPLTRLTPEQYQRIEFTQQMASYDIRALQQAWVKTRMAELTAAKYVELARIDAMEVQYWEAWEESKCGKRRTLTKGKPENGQMQPVESSISTEERAGDPRYLDGVKWCIEQRCKLLNLYAPIKVAPTDPTGNESYGHEFLDAGERVLDKLAAQVAAAQASTTQCQ